jgi:hypothetical protein
MRPYLITAKLMRPSNMKRFPTPVLGDQTFVTPLHTHPGATISFVRRQLFHQLLPFDERNARYLVTWVFLNSESSHVVEGDVHVDGVRLRLYCSHQRAYCSSPT